MQLQAAEKLRYATGPRMRYSGNFMNQNFVQVTIL